MSSVLAGSYSLTTENLCDQTSKAYFAIRNVLKTTDLDTDVILNTFDSVVQAILTYDSAVWSQLNSRQLKTIKKSNYQEERIKLTFISLFFGKSKRSIKNMKQYTWCKQRLLYFRNGRRTLEISHGDALP